MRPFARFARSESGATLVFVAITMPVIMLLLAMVIDLDIGRMQKNKLQIAADSAALAGASRLPSAWQARLEAIEYANKNYPVSGLTSVLAWSDVEIGHYDSVSGMFESNVRPRNAVRVTTRRDSITNNPIQTIFASVAGIEKLNITQSAIAISPETASVCDGGGLLSATSLTLRDDSVYDSVCLFGHREVEVYDNNAFLPEAYVVTEDADTDVSLGLGNSFVDQDEQIHSAEFGMMAPTEIGNIISKIQVLEVVPAASNTFITWDFVHVPAGTFDASALDEGKFYSVEGDVVLPAGTQFQNMGLVASGDITLAPGATFDAGFLMAEGRLSLGDNVFVGAHAPIPIDVCTQIRGTTGEFRVTAFSRGPIAIGNNATLYGTQIGTDDRLEVGTGATLHGTYAEARDAIEVDDDAEVRGCEPGMVGAFDSLPENTLNVGTVRLVN